MVADRPLRDRRLIAGTVTTLLLVTPVLVWWMVGDVSEVTDPYADYLMHPLPISRATETSVGRSSVVVAAMSAIVLCEAHRRRAFPRRRAAAVGCLLLVGVFAGYGYRVLTAGVSGANIGGGLIMMFGPFIVGGLVTAAIVLGTRESKVPLTRSW